MHWRWFVPLPLAAFLCGEAVDAPRLRAPLAVSSECAGYVAARDRYLLAYGFAREKPAVSRGLEAEALELLRGCGDAASSLLRERILEQRKI
ncbi:MAG: hypothetical protein EOP11_08965 [Proteobacteria bacterium]|nr:MAG: hypothetical protein EOP11_08965 [Pseudomonadota bacterium]